MSSIDVRKALHEDPTQLGTTETILHGFHGRRGTANARGIEDLPGKLTSQSPSHHSILGTVPLLDVHNILLLDGSSPPGLCRLAPGVDQKPSWKLIIQHIEDVHLFVAPAHLLDLCQLHLLGGAQPPGRESHLQALTVLNGLPNLLQRLALPATFPFSIASSEPFIFLPGQCRFNAPRSSKSCPDSADGRTKARDFRWKDQARACNAGPP